MKLIIAESIISALYIFDASALPVLHIPLIYLTLIYVVSMLEMLGIFSIGGWIRGRFNHHRESVGNSRLFGLP